jgi:hypothetical protein
MGAGMAILFVDGVPTRRRVFSGALLFRRAVIEIE